jgi:hypothetical protein
MSRLAVTYRFLVWYRIEHSSQSNRPLGDAYFAFEVFLDLVLSIQVPPAQFPEIGHKVVRD